MDQSVIFNQGSGVARPAKALRCASFPDHSWVRGHSRTHSRSADFCGAISSSSFPVVASVCFRRTLQMVMRDNHEIGDDAFHQVEEDLDWLDMAFSRQAECNSPRH